MSSRMYGEMYVYIFLGIIPTLPTKRNTYIVNRTIPYHNDIPRQNTLYYLYLYILLSLCYIVYVVLCICIVG